MDVRKLAELLEERYGRWQDRYPSSFAAHGGEDALDTLVLTILSQATNDVNSLRAYRRLRERFQTWDHLAAANQEEVATALRPGGLGEQKAARIQAILRSIRDERGSLDLEFLADMGPAEAFDYLTSFPGVGPKTAACVLLFALGHPRFPVDTHIARVAARLGLVEKGLSAVRVQQQMEGLVPDDLKMGLHVNLIEHGRHQCRARAPLCETCFLLPGCRWAAARPGRPEP